MSEFVNQLVKGKKGAQAAGVLLFGLGAFLIISLVSHSALDYPNSSRSVAEGFNWGGRIGAYISYGGFAAMGLAAYVWPLLAFFWGWNRLRHQPPLPMAYRSLGLLGMAALFSVATGLPSYSPHTAFKLGGVFGSQISLLVLIPYLGRLGAAVLLGALFVAALVLTTDLNLRPIGQALGWVVGAVRRAVLRVWRQPGLWWAAWRERRAVRAAERAVARAAKREESAEDIEPEEDEEEVVVAEG